MTKYIILISASLLLGCSSNQESLQEAAVTTNESVEPNASTAIDSENQTTRIHCNGRVEAAPQHIADVHARMPVYVEEIRVLPGQRVQKGEVLAVVSSEDVLQWRVQMRQIKSDLDRAHRQFERDTELWESQAISEKAFEESRAEYEVLQAKYDGIKSQLAFVGATDESVATGTVSILSPVTGFVESVGVNQGKHVQTAERLFRVLDDGALHLELFVFATDVALVQQGQTVLFRQSGRTKADTATVFLVNDAVDPATQCVTVHAEVVSGVGGLTYGAYIDAEIEQ